MSGSWVDAVAALTKGASWGWWRLGESSGTAADDSGPDNHDGTHGGSTVTVGQAGGLVGDANKSAKYTGTNPATTVTGASWMETTAPHKFSIAAIVKPDAALIAASNILVARDTQSAGRRFQIQVNSSGHLTFIVLDTSSNPNPAAKANNYADGDWHLVVGVYDASISGSGRVKCYVDDEAVANASSTNGLNVTGTPSLSIGNALRTTQSPANSWVDEVIFLPGVAMTDAERLSLYTAMTTGGTPGVPTAVTATPAETSISLSWGAPATGGLVTSYEVRIDGGTPVTATSPHDFTGLTAETSYDLEVRAVGPAGSSSWVLITEETTATPVPTPPGYFRVELDLGAHSWTIERGDPFAYGPILPLSLGWDISDDVEFFPSQANMTTLSLMIQCEEASELADVVKGSTITFRMFVDADPDADPWQSFTGVVTQLDGATVAPGTQARADAGQLDFRVTVFAADDNARLADMFVGYTDDWPVDYINARAERISDEAGIGAFEDLWDGGVGWLRERDHGSAISVLAALQATFKDAAEHYDSESPAHYYGRPFFQYVHAEDTLYVFPFRRRVFPSGFGSTVTLSGDLVRAAGQWVKRPGPAAATWVIVDTTVFGTPDSTVPYVRSTSLFDTFDQPGDPVNHSATERDALGESLLADGSTALDGWSTRSLIYEAHIDPAPVFQWANLYRYGVAVHPVVITPIGSELELNGVDYLAGTLTGARLVIPAGGDFYLELRLRNELLPGTELP